MVLIQEVGLLIVQNTMQAASMEVNKFILCLFCVCSACIIILVQFLVIFAFFFVFVFLPFLFHLR